METFRITDLTFAYPGQPACLKKLSLHVEPGQFITLCGKSGCGKTTLLRLLKPTLAPCGETQGSIFFQGAPLSALSLRQQAEKIGFVQQSPEHQLVTDKVWHELAFGLESLGLSNERIRAHVSEMASFFGIQTWFHKAVTDLSGGQKQLLNLAAVMVMQPDVLLLDEPTSQLDPIAASEFLDALAKLNREFGTTILLVEHRLEEALPLSERVLVLDAGELLVDASPQEVGRSLRGHDLFSAMPTPLRVSAAVSNDCPLTVRQGRQWLADYAVRHPLTPLSPPAPASLLGNPAILLKEVWFQYSRGLPEVLKGLSVAIHPGELFAIVGGNGTGKSTALSVISGLLRPQRGSVQLEGRAVDSIPDAEKYIGLLGMLPQNPQALFVANTVGADLRELFDGTAVPPEEQQRRLVHVISLCQLGTLLSRHPHDLSGGEQQRAALAKVLLLQPRILLLDEPTKGLDSHFKSRLAGILRTLQQEGVCLVMVSHDIEFCAQNATRCAMFFDGAITAIASARTFFAGMQFYTTAAQRMARGILPAAVVAEDLIAACGGAAAPPPPLTHTSALPQPPISSAKRPPPPSASPGPSLPTRPKRQTAAALLMLLLAVPATIYLGITLLDDRTYYFINLLIVLEAMLPFALRFERRRPQARELIVIAVLTALAVAGRAAFFMVPQFKPSVAIVILAGVCFGGEAGFLTGAMTAFVSNFFFGQGPWTPWQMFALGSIGFLAGLLCRMGLLSKRRGALCIFGILASFFLYGGVMDTANVLMAQAVPTWGALLISYGLGAPFNAILAGATACFLWFLSQPLLEKLERIRVKYGIIA